MQYLKISAGILLAISASRLIPHPPNFTSLIAISFYIPAIFGYRYIAPVIFAFGITDLILGFHNVILFTWGSIILIGIISKYFSSSLTSRFLGMLTGAVIFFLTTNFGVWLIGSYGYTFSGLITCFVLAIPFFTNTVVSSVIYGFIIEMFWSIYKNYLKNKFI